MWRPSQAAACQGRRRRWSLLLQAMSRPPAAAVPADTATADATLYRQFAD